MQLAPYVIKDLARGFEVPLDAFGFLVARALTVQRETDELAALIDAPRVELQLSLIHI